MTPAQAHSSRFVGRGLTLLICSLFPLAAADVQGQSPTSESSLTTRAWEYSPYQIMVWLVDDGSTAARLRVPEISQRIVRDAQFDDYNAWHVRCERADSLWNNRFQSDWDPVPEKYAAELGNRLAADGVDKLIVIRILPEHGAYSIAARELDLMTRQWGEAAYRIAGQPAMIPGQCYQALRSAFMPLARIERVAEKTIYTRLRAVNLSRDVAMDEAGNPTEIPLKSSPVWIQPTDILLPVIRRNDRDDQFASVEIADLTFLTVESREDSVVKCQMFTAQFAPLSGRTGSRTQKFALVVRPRGSETRLELISKDPKNPAPMPGMEVYSRRPGEESIDDQLLGKTDWKGTILIPPSPDGTVRLIHVKNGKRDLKMVPVMPGLFTWITAAVPDDKARMFAEGVAMGWKNRILDFVARREILKSRIKAAIAEKNFTKAREIYEKEFDKLPTASEFSFQLGQTKERLLTRKDADNNQRERIARMFESLDRVVGDKIKDTESTDLYQRIMTEDATDPDATEADMTAIQRETEAAPATPPR